MLSLTPLSNFSLRGALALLTWQILLCQPAIAQRAPDWLRLRATMVQDEIVRAGIKNPRVIDSVLRTPRHEFVMPAERSQAYLDMALPIGSGQTISPPFVVAYMTESLEPEPEDKVLEIGTGSGYQAAILSPLVREVYSIEIVAPLGNRAAKTLKRLGYSNVFTKVGDGFQGWPEHAPFDKIIVTCSPEDVPRPLIEQLKEGGRMIVPLGERYQQTLYMFTKRNGELEREALLPTLFVPMTGLAESERQKLPDPLHPAVNNGGFEEIIGDPESQSVIGWHYQRQLQLPLNDGAPAGEHYAKFTNDQPGRSAQALQGLGIDGRAIQELEASCWVRGKGIKPGQNPEQLGLLMIHFYDEQRETVGTSFLGPWRGDFEWKQVKGKIRVPPTAREAIIGVGLFGAVGELSVDLVEIEPTKRKGK
jgi:protein-L-isoaspartate(D-aspartate) O-methyltransferase